MPVPFSIISSAADFQRVFTPPKPTLAAASKPPPIDALMLCYETPDEGVTADGLTQFRHAVESAATRYNTSLSVYLWDCSSDAFTSAKAQLGKVKGSPLLLIIYRGAIADTVRDATLSRICAEDVPRVCERLAAYQRSGKPAEVVPSSPTPGSAQMTVTALSGGEGRVLRVDVGKIVGLGKELLGKGEAVYAEKVFVKALNALKAVEPQVLAGMESGTGTSTSLDEYNGSVAMTLAWAGLAQIVQGKRLIENTYLKQLTQEDRFASFCSEPMSDACRVVATRQLMLAAPGTWTSATCSQKVLREVLAADPMNHKSRAMLVITLFLAGDLERSLTEAVKLRSLNQDFGRVALKSIVMFLGPDHTLVKQLGPLSTTRTTW